MIQNWPNFYLMRVFLTVFIMNLYIFLKLYLNCILLVIYLKMWEFRLKKLSLE